MHTETPVKRLTPDVQFTPELMDSYVMRGRQLRARAVADFLHGLFSKTPPVAETADVPAGGHESDPGKFKNSLTAIRCAAEVLRDNPGIALSERQRFIDIVLKEEARLERLVGRGLKLAG